jgi:hypothetical protein
MKHIEATLADAGDTLNGLAGLNTPPLPDAPNGLDTGVPNCKLPFRVAMQ